MPCTAHSRHLLKADSYASFTSVSKTTPFFPSLAKPYPTQVIFPYQNKGLPLFRDKEQTYLAPLCFSFSRVYKMEQLLKQAAGTKLLFGAQP